MLKKTLKWIGGIVLIVAILFVVVVGPWPTYAAGNLEGKSYYRNAIAKIDENLAHSTIGKDVQPLEAGWAKAEITPPIGTPLSGFGQRQGKPSTGVHDPIFVRALALNDGKDTAVLVGSDMLIVPDNIANIARADAAAETPLTPNDILFNASHTHSGPGAWGPGYAAYQFSGQYNEQVVTDLGHAFGRAIIDAYRSMEPAEFAYGRLDVPEFIKNRVRDAEVDDDLQYLIVRQKDGDACYLVCYNAHPTVLGGGNMEFSADFPGYLYRHIESTTGKFSMYLGGAVGSMGPRVEGPDGFTRARIMGEALAQRVLDDSANAEFSDTAEIAAVGFAFNTPPLQLRINRNWRVSPLLIRALGVDNVAWVHGIRVGKLMFYGTPCDLSGEISVEMKRWAASRGVELWALSFAGDYIGYVSPQKYYETADPRGDDAYEMYLMSWIGPNQEPFFTGLMQHMAGKMFPPAMSATASSG